MVPVIALLAGAAFTAQATMSRDHAPSEIVPLSVDMSAASMIGASDAAPAQGTTGSVTLPDLPHELATPAVADASIVAAQPFRLRGSPLDHSRAIECLTAAIYYEAASEPGDGQRAVAQVVLNRVRHPAFPATVCGVVYQGSDKSVCQFSFACDGAMARRPMASAWARARIVAADALAGRVFAPVGLATHYHTYAVTPSWNRSLVMTGVHGAHFFHRWKGGWGTAAAFRDRYMGGEPLPGPLGRTDMALASVAALPAVTVAPPTIPTPATIADTPSAQVQPAYIDSGKPVDQSAESQILDRWKDSGQPIR